MRGTITLGLISPRVSMAQMVVSHLGRRSPFLYLLPQMRMLGAMCTWECLLNGCITCALVRVRNKYGLRWYGGVQVALVCSVVSITTCIDKKKIRS